MMGNHYHVALTSLDGERIEARLGLPCTIKMGNLRFLFFSIKINVSLETFNSETEI